MPRKLTVTTGVVLALAFAGCGKDSNATSVSQSAATTTTPAATTTTPAAKGTTTTASGTKTTGSKSAASKATDAQPTGSKTKTGTSGASGSASKGKASKTSKTATTTTTPAPKTPTPSVVPKKDLTSGTGSGPGPARLEVVGVLRRYYKGFIDKDGATVCSLLTSAGKQTMIGDGNGKSCPDSVKRLIGSASADNIALLQRTRDGLHVDDITVNGDNATAQIGKTSQLRLVQTNGQWLLRSPNVVVSKS